MAVKTELGCVLSGLVNDGSFLCEYDAVNFAVAKTDLQCKVEKFSDSHTVGV